MPTTSFVLSFHRHFVFTKKAASYGDKLVVGLGEWGGDEWGGEWGDAPPTSAPSLLPPPLPPCSHLRSLPLVFSGTDEVCAGYKRPPIMTEAERRRALLCLPWVTTIVYPTAFGEVDAAFLRAK